MSSPSLKSVRVRLCVWAVRLPVRTWCLGFKAQGIDTLPLTGSLGLAKAFQGLAQASQGLTVASQGLALTSRGLNWVT